MPETHAEFVVRQKAALNHRAAIRALEAQNGVAYDTMGAYWLARTAALERLAHEAQEVLKVFPDPALEKAVADLRALKEPACREGDHDGR